MTNDKLALILSDKLLIKVQKMLDAEVKTIAADIQDTEKDVKDKRSISLKLDIQVTDNHQSLAIEGSSKSSVPTRKLEKSFISIDVNNSGQINLFESAED